LLSKKKIDAIYSTDYKRTKATAQPTATNHGLSIETYDSKSSHPNYFKQYRKTYIDSSNTALEIIEAAGVQNHLPPLQMKNMIFILVTIKKNGTAKVRAMKYGTKEVIKTNKQTIT
jgi:hypothetical protein